MAQVQDAGFHESFGREHEVEGSTDRGFGLVFAGFFTLVALLPLLSEPRRVRVWSLGVAAACALIAWVAPRVLAPANRLWMRFGLLLQKVVSPIVLGILFFGVITPFGVAMRLFGKDPLRLEWKKDAPTYWITREPPGPPPETMKNQF
ncbi:MAG: hypothetical protein IT384_17090 [Deltaproteobacteria bacterium]|nr:hypothetical protein [Deltaproteobacteria bacterium]